MTVHLIKLCVGVDSIEDLRSWHKERLATLKKRGQKLEGAVARLVEHGVSLLETGALRMTASDLIAAVRLWAQLRGLLSDQPVNNVIIRNHMSALEDIANEKDEAKLKERLNSAYAELQDMGVFPKDRN